MLGDVIAIYTSADNLVAKYTYDTWGKLLSIMDANESDISSTSGIWLQNSIRYRGYVYDNETGWYYLQSRYYDPDTCRFINADGMITANNNFTINLFAYADCNPLVNIDPTGTCPYNGTKEDFIRLEQGLPSVDCVCQDNTYIATFSKKATNRPDSGLQNIPDDEIQRRARDKSLSGKERRRYQEEEKVRGIRNKQKRQSNMVYEPNWDLLFGCALAGVSIVGIVYVIGNDTTGVGVIDNAFISALVKAFKEGIQIIFNQTTASATA